MIEQIVESGFKTIGHSSKEEDELKIDQIAFKAKEQIEKIDFLKIRVNRFIERLSYEIFVLKTLHGKNIGEKKIDSIAKKLEYDLKAASENLLKLVIQFDCISTVGKPALRKKRKQHITNLNNWIDYVNDLKSRFLSIGMKLKSIHDRTVNMNMMKEKKIVDETSESSDYITDDNNEKESDSSDDDEEEDRDDDEEEDRWRNLDKRNILRNIGFHQQRRKKPRIVPRRAHPFFGYPYYADNRYSHQQYKRKQNPFFSSFNESPFGGVFF
jgi:hypothetical protein